MSGTVLLGALLRVGLALLLTRFARMERRLDRLSRIDRKLDALLKHAAVSFDVYEDVPADVRDAIERGETIEAVRRFRQATGVGLKEAKDFVDEVRRRQAGSM